MLLSRRERKHWGKWCRVGKAAAHSRSTDSWDERVAFGKKSPTITSCEVRPSGSIIAAISQRIPERRFFGQMNTRLGLGKRCLAIRLYSQNGWRNDAAKAASTFWRPATERPKWLRLQPQDRFLMPLKQHPLLVPSHRAPKVAAASAAGSSSPLLTPQATPSAPPQLFPLHLRPAAGDHH